MLATLEAQCDPKRPSRPQCRIGINGGLLQCGGGPNEHGECEDDKGCAGVKAETIQ